MTEAARAATDHAVRRRSRTPRRTLVALVHLHKALTVGLQFAGSNARSASVRREVDKRAGRGDARTAAAARRYCASARTTLV